MIRETKPSGRGGLVARSADHGRVISRTLAFKHWLGRQGWGVLIVAFLIVIGLWVFVELADETIEGATRAFDEAVILAMRDQENLSDLKGPEWLEELGRDITALGGMGILTFLTFAVAGLLQLQRKSRASLYLILSVAGGLVLSQVLKAGFDRPRPELVPHESYVYTASFPSGHSTMSAVTYLTMGLLLARIHGRRSVKVYLVCLSLLMTAGVGLSRVYLGVHWPTDVLAGWLLGMSWALFCWLTAVWLGRRGKIEEETGTE